MTAEANESVNSNLQFTDIAPRRFQSTENENAVEITMDFGLF